MSDVNLNESNFSSSGTSMKKTIFTIISTVIVTVMVIAAGLLYTMGFDLQRTAEIMRLIAVERFIEVKYVNGVDTTTLINGAIDGMMKSLDDPHSMYLDTEKYDQLKAQTDGTFGGVGIVMSFVDGHVRVNSVLEATPAEDVGIQKDDEILAVDGVNVSDMQPDEVAMHIRGKEGTTVTLTIHRDGTEDRDYELTRSTISYKTCDGDMVPNEDGMGYIRIASFSENTDTEFADTLKKLEEQGLKGLIIDLRSNPGGQVDTCVNIANLVVPAGDVVSVVYKDGSKETYGSNLQELNYPIVVLIDGNSASASEILAGALKDRGVATLVGTKSFGKGSVQMVMPMVEGDAMKLTIAKYYTPSGNNIDGVGIEPDVSIELPKDATADVQLQKAIEVMRSKLQ